MLRFLIASSLLCVLLNSCSCNSHKFTNIQDEPLFLTKYIESGDIQEAKKAAVVKLTAENIETYAGLITVNKTYDKNLFIWFCTSENNYKEDPVVLWLQGGPGASSMLGLFTENGPFKLQKNPLRIEVNQYSWSKNHNVLYIDNPAGTGYSFTTPNGLNTNEEQIGLELFEALSQFFMLFPELRKNEFFVTGESYAGKYIPVLSYTILIKNRYLPDDKKINMKGLAIGNGIIDPVNQLNLGEYAYQHGLVDLNTKELMEQHQKRITEFINEERYSDATNENKLLIATFRNASGFKNVYNYLYPLLEDDGELLNQFLTSRDVRKAIHVGNLTRNDGDDASDALHEDIMKSVVNILPELIENYRVLLYNGQMDTRLPYPCMVNFIQKLKFNAADEYKTAERSIWYVDGDIAGYSKVAGNLTELLIRNAGHLVPMDQPQWASDMITRFTRNKPFQ